MTEKHDHTHETNAGSSEIRTAALEDLLVEKGLVDRSRIDSLVERFEHDLGPMIGARLVAKAWLESDFQSRLVSDADEVLRQENIRGGEIEHVEVKVNEPGIHNVVVCTLCSCYPWALLGLPPAWYKSPEYRARVVREPRKVLEEMGLSLEPDTEIRVWDSSSETRFLVLPEQPAGSEDLGMEDLAALVTRDSMIGVAKALSP
ncbi:MAG: nitrile hydratase subunit alpha [Acidimicrobiaceae bacterium]|nr:nitrile hydratase subunit alpha [Acidimicrobiaceae bacterium]